jgi:hypothetical protein
LKQWVGDLPYRGDGLISLESETIHSRSGCGVGRLTITEHGRFLALRDGAGELIAITVYNRRGAARNDA